MRASSENATCDPHVSVPFWVLRAGSYRGMLLRQPGASGRASYERTGVRPTFSNLRGREGVKPVTYGFFGHFKCSVFRLHPRPDTLGTAPDPKGRNPCGWAAPGALSRFTYGFFGHRPLPTAVIHFSQHSGLSAALPLEYSLIRYTAYCSP